MAALAAESETPAPLRPTDVMPDRHWDVIALDLALTIDLVGKSVEGTATHTVRPLGRRVGHLRLDQVALDIREVRVDGAVVEGWRVGPDRIEIPMPSTGEEHVVAVSYAATPELGLHFRGPPADAYVEVWSQGQDVDNRYWFPTWDYPSDTFSYTGTFTAPADQVVLSNGERVDRTEHDGMATWRYRLDGPMPAYLVALAVGPYTVVEADGPVPLEYVAGPGYTEAEITQALGDTPAMMAWMGERLDEPYPWPALRQVFVQRFLYGAMENTALVVHADFLLRPNDGPGPVYTEEVVAHELAHQWFGDRVTPYGWRDLWLSEAFASFYSAQWQQHSRGEAFWATKIDDWQHSAYRDDMALAPSMVPPGDLTGAAILQYARGGLALHGLRTWLGAEVFDQAVAAYLDEHVGEMVETADFRRALEDASGTHLAWWFDTYVHGTTFPKANTRWSWADGSLTVEIEQTTEGASYEAPLVVEIGTATGSREVPTWLGPGTTRVVVEMPEAPAWVSVDPEGAVIATWEHTQDPAAWVAQLKHSERPYARIVAMAHLHEGKGGADAVTALRDAARGDDDPTYRVKAIEALGQIATRDAVAALVDGLSDADADIRAACAHALTDAPETDATAQALDDLALRDPDPKVRAAAHEGLAGHDLDAALVLARKRIGVAVGANGPSEAATAVEILRDHGDAADFARLLAVTEPGRAFWPMWKAVWGLPDALARVDEGDKRDAARAKLSRRLEGLLHDGDVRLRGAAIHLLGRVGDEASASTLTAFASECEVPLLAEEARDAAAKVRERAANGEPEAEPEEPGEPTDVERLEERLEALEERLKRLEDWRY